MTGVTDLDILLKDMNPVLVDGDFVFCSLDVLLNETLLALEPEAIIKEDEGLTLILNEDVAKRNLFEYEGSYKKITLEVHSSLEAVGLTAAFAKALTEANISANVVAGYYHDHIFIPKEDAARAMKALKALT